MLQLVSGSIFISTTPVSLVSGDGIIIESDEKGEVYKVNLYVSFIAEDGIEITEGYEPQEEATTPEGVEKPHPMKVISIKGTKFSFIGEDGITVAQSEESVTKTDDQGNTTTEKMQVVTIGNDNNKEYEFVGKDGVEVTTEEVTTTENGKEVKKTKVTIGASVIADVDIDVRGGSNVTVDKTTEGTTQVFTVNTSLPQIEQVSIVAGDGITVTHSSNTYTISATLSGITYDFDPSWFIVTDTTVTINEAKFEEVAASLAPTVSSQITTVATSNIDGVNDCGREADIMLEINTTGDTASARAWTEW